MLVRPSIRSLILLTAACVLGAAEAAAAEIKPGRFNIDADGSPVDLTEDFGEAAVEAADRQLNEAESDREFVIAPLPTRNPALGWTLAAPAMFMYRPSSIDEDDSAWITGAGGFYAENKSWGAGAFHRMSLDEDTWRISAGGFYGDVRYDYYGIGGGPDRQTELIPPIPLRQTMSFLSTEVLYAVRPKLYMGLKLNYADTTAKLDLRPEDEDSFESPFIPDLSRSFQLATLAPRLKYDTRDVEFYPTKGWLIDGTASVGLEALGGSSDYELYKINANTFYELGDRSVLASRVALEYAGGDAPFFLFPAFGSGVDLRGYTTGTYRNRSLLAGQMEYRFRYSDRWGVVGFVGVGSVAPDFMGWTESLYSYGIGLRWVAAPKNNLSLRVDWAWGKGDNQFYVGLGEAF